MSDSIAHDLELTAVRLPNFSWDATRLRKAEEHFLVADLTPRGRNWPSQPVENLPGQPGNDDAVPRLLRCLGLR